MNKGFALVYKKLIFEKNKRNMSTAYKIAKKEGAYYLSFQVVAWVDIFIPKLYRDIVIDSFENNLNDGRSLSRTEETF